MLWEIIDVRNIKNPMSEKSKEVIDALDGLFGMTPDPNWFTNNK